MNEISLSSAVWKTFLPPYISRNWLLLLLSTFCFIVTAPRGIALMGGGGLGFEPPIPLSFYLNPKAGEAPFVFRLSNPIAPLGKAHAANPPPSRFTPTVW